MELSDNSFVCMYIQLSGSSNSIKFQQNMSHIICSFTQLATCAAPCRCWPSSEQSRRGLLYNLAQIVPMYQLTLPASFSRCRHPYGNRCLPTWTTAWWRCCHLNWRPRQTFYATSWRNGTSDWCRNDCLLSLSQPSLGSLVSEDSHLVPHLIRYLVW